LLQPKFCRSNLSVLFST